MSKTAARKGINYHQRHKARQRAVQALYQWLLNPIAATSLVVEFFNGKLDMKKIDADYFQKLLTGAIENNLDLEQLIQKYAAFSVDNLDPTEKAILLMASYELQQCIETPKAVVIDEAIELAKIYGAVDSYKFINGVLDKMSKTLRSHES